MKARYLFETIVKFSAKLSRIYCLSDPPRFVPPRPVAAKPNYGAIRGELSSLAGLFSMVSVSSSLLSLFIVASDSTLILTPPLLPFQTCTSRSCRLLILLPELLLTCAIAS